MQRIRTRWQALNTHGYDNSKPVNRWVAVWQWANALCLLFIWAGMLIVMNTKVNEAGIIFAGHHIEGFFGWYYTATATYCVIVALSFVVRLLGKTFRQLRRL